MIKNNRIVIVVIVAVIALSGFLIYWFVFRVTPAGTYSKFSISFDYPEGTTIKEDGWLGNTPDTNSGFVTCYGRRHGTSYSFVLGWKKTDYYDIDAGFEMLFSSIKSATNLVKEERATSSLSGHILHYQECEFDDTENNRHYHQVMGISYWTDLEKVFIVSYVSELESPFERMEEFLEAFEAN